MTTELASFNEAIAAIPFEPLTPQATGLLAPIMRASGHILYLVGATAEPGYTLTEEEAQRELVHASAHLAGTTTTATHAPLSTEAKARITAFVLAVAFAANDIHDTWSDEERGPNLRSLADRAAALAAFLDFELAGVTASDPGRTL